MVAKPWIFELVAALLESEITKSTRESDERVPLLQTSHAGSDDFAKICIFIPYAAQLHVRDGSRDSLNKARFLLRGIAESSTCVN
jgi:hypothetical protein